MDLNFIAICCLLFLCNSVSGQFSLIACRPEASLPSAQGPDKEDAKKCEESPVLREEVKKEEKKPKKKRHTWAS